MKAKQRVLTIALTVFIFLFAATSLWAAPKYTFSVGNDAAEDTVTHLMSLRIKELLEEKSGGTMRVDVYPNAQLGKDQELATSCQLGDIAFVVQNIGNQVYFVKSAAVFDMPNLFTNIASARKAIDKFLAESGILDDYEKAGFKLLAVGDQGFRVLTTNKEVHKIPDLKGLKLRTMENRYHMAYWQALGANPTPLPFAEVYLSLQQGTIDGQENPYEVFIAGKFYEQQKYVVGTNHLFHTISILMSKQIFDSLTPEEQKMVAETIGEVGAWGREQADKRHADRVALLQKHGTQIIELDPEVLKEIREKSQPVYDMIRKEVGAKLADKLLSDAAATGN